MHDGEQYVISTTVPTFHAVQDALQARKFVIESAEIAMVPKNSVKVEGKQAEQMIKLLEALEELDDVSQGLLQLRYRRERAGRGVELNRPGV